MPARSRARGIPAAGASAANTSTPSRPSHPLDPSEEITPEELASIPEPVPLETSSAAEGQDTPDGAESSLRSAPSTDEEHSASEARGDPSTASAGDRASRDGVPGWVWRVQVFASENLRLADRKAKEATERLQVRAHLEFETPYYKVRLGDFATEVEAQTLRERAIQAGYSGAFRTRCAPDTTQYED